MDNVDEYILILICEIEKIFFMVVEDVFLIIGCGIVVIGCVECGIVIVGDNIEIIGYVEICIVMVIGLEMF